MSCRPAALFLAVATSQSPGLPEQNLLEKGDVNKNGSDTFDSTAY